MSTHITRPFRTRQFRLRVWKALNAVVAVITVANVSLVGTLIAPTMAEAADTGWKAPSTNSNLNPTVTNPANAYTDNGVNAIFDDTANHKYGGFGIAIPAGMTVNGIEVRIQGCSNGGDKDFRVYLTEDNGSNWGSHKSANDFDSNCETRTLGGSNDKWGRTTWTPSELANGNFFVRLQSDFSSGTVGIDFVAVKVYFGGYTFNLTSPTPPTQTDTFTWTLDGEKPGPGKEISHFSLQGCWEEKDIKSVSISENPPAETDDWDWDFIDPPGGPKSIKINNLNSDNDLPATITVVFNQSYLSNGTVTGWVKQGSSLVAYQADGPNCNTPREEPVTINAWKIVCTDEADLPNWGASGGPNITPTTAQDWVNNHQSCSFAPDWNFQWAPDFEGQPTPGNPGDNTGAAGSPWTTFGPTDANGFTSVTVEDVSDTELIWVREVWQNGYIPFTMGPNYDNSNDVSAEMYCHTDVINYDNYDWISGLQKDATYNCVAWNVLARQPQGTLVVHKQADTDGDGVYELTVTDTEGGFGWKVEGDDEWSTFGSSKGLAPETYTVLEKEVSGYHMTGWVSGSPDGDICGGDVKLNVGNPQVEIVDNQETHITFCNQVNGGITGTKYYDWDRDGETDDGDQSIAEWDITLHELYGEGSSVVGTVQTDANGQYAFTNLEPGNYLVCEAMPDGWAPTGAGAWTDKGWCQEASVGGTYDFHNYLTGVIHGQKFNDLNGNGVRDCELPDFSATSNELVQITPECEPSLNGWTVFIDENDNGALDEGEPSMETQFHDGPFFDDNGWYWFEDLQPGAYKVCEVQQNDWNQTYPVNANDNCHTITVPQGSEGDTCFNPLTRQVSLVENNVYGPTCDFGNQFVPVTTIELEKEADVTEITAGGNITYTLTWTVSGNTPATNAVITDGIPDNTTYVSSDGDYDAVAKAVTWNLGTKNPGETGQVTVTVKSVTPVTDGTLVTNTGTFDTDQNDPVQASANTTLRYTPTTPTVLGDTTEPGLSLAKTVSAKTVKPGDVVTYTITVSSTGDGDAENIVVTDTLPDGLAFVDGGGKTMTWTIDALAPGTSQDIEVNVRVESDAVRGEYVNIATATANEVSEVQASATIEVRNPAVLGLATTGSGLLDYAIFLIGALFLTFGFAGLKQVAPVRIRPRS